MASVYINALSSYETNNVTALDLGAFSTASVRYTQSNFSAAGLTLPLLGCSK